MLRYAETLHLLPTRRMEKRKIALNWVLRFLDAHRAATAFGKCKAKQLHESLYSLELEAAKRVEIFADFGTRFCKFYSHLLNLE